MQKLIIIISELIDVIYTVELYCCFSSRLTINTLAFLWMFLFFLLSIYHLYRSNGQNMSRPSYTCLSKCLSACVFHHKLETETQRAGRWVTRAGLRLSEKCNNKTLCSQIFLRLTLLTHMQQSDPYSLSIEKCLLQRAALLHVIIIRKEDQNQDHMEKSPGRWKW